jgi:aryl-alcohol dehydrogenase-like predicted oxidoreductase
MSWPGCRYGELSASPGSADAATRMVAAALDRGITLIDTAEGYGRGLAETHLGFAIRQLGCAGDLTIVTKTGPLFEGEREDGRTCDLSQGHLFERVDAALRRLGVERIDVLLAHWPDAKTPIEETMAAVAGLKAAGKIRHFGVSNFSNDLLAAALRCGEIVCNQLPCSLADRSIEDGRRQFCLEQGVGIMAYSPIGKGVLSGKYDIHKLPPDGDYRYQRPHFRENLEQNLRLADKIRTLASELETEPVAVALAWTLLLPGVTVAIPGAKTPDQIDGHAKAAALITNPGAADKIRQLG